MKTTTATKVSETTTQVRGNRRRVEWSIVLECGHTVERVESYRGAAFPVAPRRCKCNVCGK